MAQAWSHSMFDQTFALTRLPLPSPSISLRRQPSCGFIPRSSPATQHWTDPFGSQGALRARQLVHWNSALLGQGGQFRKQLTADQKILLSNVSEEVCSSTERPLLQKLEACVQPESFQGGGAMPNLKTLRRITLQCVGYQWPQTPIAFSLSRTQEPPSPNEP